MLLHTIVFSRDDFIFKSKSIANAAGHRLDLDSISGDLKLGWKT